jgi:hypothetical protein
VLDEMEEKENISATLALELHPSSAIRTTRDAGENESSISATVVALCSCSAAHGRFGTVLITALFHTLSFITI